MAERFGKPLMPWQEQVAMVGGEIDPATGLPAYRDVVVTVPRQSGKTTLILAWEIQRALGWGSPQSIVYTAQDGSAARKKLLNDQGPILEPIKSKLGIRRILKGAGNEAVEFRNGSRIGLLASGDDAGHGMTLDLAIKDEFWKDADDRRDQALGPAMITRPAAQKLTASTMGNEASIPLNELVERGRKAVLADQRTGIAYFEWSAEAEDDHEDEDVWRRCMPALGLTISERDIRHELDVTFAGKAGEFRRAYLNIPSSLGGDRLIPAEAWAACCDPSHDPTGPLAYALDVTPEATAASIAISDGSHLEVVKHEAGTHWVVDACVAKRDRFTEIVLDPMGPAGALVAPLESAGITVRQVTTKEAVAACGQFLTAVTEHTVRHIGQPEFDLAAGNADRRDVGDGGWLWSRRKSSVDISPLVAATLARWAAGATPPVPTPGFVDLADFMDEE